MPRSAGEADKLGNQYEAIWTVDAVLDVFLGAFKAITVEAFGDESKGVEFHLQTPNNTLQFHSVKRQKQGRDWSIADLCRKNATTGRSILGDLFEKRRTYPDAELRFVSGNRCERASRIVRASRDANQCFRLQADHSAEATDLNSMGELCPFVMATNSLHSRH